MELQIRNLHLLLALCSFCGSSGSIPKGTVQQYCDKFPDNLRPLVCILQENELVPKSTTAPPCCCGSDCDSRNAPRCRRGCPRPPPGCKTKCGGRGQPPCKTKCGGWGEPTCPTDCGGSGWGEPCRGRECGGGGWGQPPCRGRECGGGGWVETPCRGGKECGGGGGGWGWKFHPTEPPGWGWEDYTSSSEEDEEECKCDLTCYPGPCTNCTNEGDIQYSCQTCGTHCPVTSAANPTCDCAFVGDGADAQTRCSCGTTCARAVENHAPVCIFNVTDVTAASAAGLRSVGCECSKSRAAESSQDPNFVCVCQRL